MPAYQFKSKIPFLRVKIDKPLDFAHIENVFADKKFLSIDNLPTESLSHGFVSALDIDSPVSAATFGNFLIVIYRTDTRKVNASALKREFNKALEKEHIANQESGKQFVSRERKKEIREIVKLNLMKQTLPTTKLEPVIFDMSSHHLYVSSSNLHNADALMNQIFDDLQIGLSDVTEDHISSSDYDYLTSPTFLDYLWVIDQTFTPTMAHDGDLRTSSNIEADMAFARSSNKRFGKGTFSLFVDEETQYDMDLVDSQSLFATVKIPNFTVDADGEDEASFILASDHIVNGFEIIKQKHLEFMEYSTRNLESALQETIKSFL